MRPVISVNHLGKRYRLGSKSREDTLRDQIAGGLRRLFQPKTENQKSENGDEFFWALKDLSFNVAQGEVVGIMGRNGAGKSTLLKVLSQITEPTEGEVRMRGRIASLLEVGTGFHPELSGRENVYLNGAILGMSRSEIKKKFDEIAAFAEVEKFLDTPVKRYSSGMYVRLAFAVAAHLESEILVVDEVLAVGDAAFQKKCLGKMKDIGSSGRTVIFVSHNMGTVSNLCTRGIVIEQGRMGFDGGVTEAIQHYTHTILARNASQEAKDSNVIYAAPQNETKDFFVTKIEFLSLDGLQKKFIATWDGVIIRFHYRCKRAVERGAVVAQALSFDGKSLFNISTQPDSTLPLSFKAGDAAVDLVIPKFPLAAGEYILAVGLAIPWVEYLFLDPGLTSFTVFPRDVYSSGLAPAEPRSVIAFEHAWQEVKTL